LALWVWAGHHLFVFLCQSKGFKDMAASLLEKKNLSWISILISDGSGSNFFDPGRVETGQPSLFWVWISKIPQKLKKIKYFSLSFKKISSDWVKKYTRQIQIGILLTAGQKYARVGSGPIYNSEALCQAQISSTEYWLIF